MEKDLDKKIYNEYLNGEKGAFELLYNKYKGKIQYFVYNIVKDYQKAEDITQDVFIYVMQNKIKEGYTFKYYIYLVAKSRAYNQVNMEKRRTQINEEYISNETKQVGQDVAEIITNNEKKKELMDAINMLDDRYKNAIYLVKIEELTCQETAEILGESVQNIKNLIHRGKKDLRKILIKKGFDEMNKVSKVVVIILCLVFISGVAYAATYYIKSIWKQPEKFNYEKEQEVTENDKQEAMSEDEAIKIAENILYKLGYENVTYKDAKLVKYPDRKEMRWYMIFENLVTIDLDAYTGRFKGFSDTGIDDMKVKSTFSSKQAEKAAKEMYNELNLGFGEEYTLEKIEKVLIEEESPLWRAYFCKVYDGIINDYESIRLTIIPETKQLWGLNVFDYETQNNPLMIDENTAIQTAKNKAKEIREDNKEIKEITAKLTFEKMNTYIYSMEQSIIGKESKKVGDTDTQITSIDDVEAYRTEQLVRKVWSVVIKYYDEDFADEMKFYVDATTGEIIGGDAVK